MEFIEIDCAKAVKGDYHGIKIRPKNWESEDYLYFIQDKVWCIHYYETNMASGKKITTFDNNRFNCLSYDTPNHYQLLK